MGWGWGKGFGDLGWSGALEGPRGRKGEKGENMFFRISLVIHS